jgi:hypothetical protein
VHRANELPECGELPVDVGHRVVELCFRIALVALSVSRESDDLPSNLNAPLRSKSEGLF